MLWSIGILSVLWLCYLLREARQVGHARSQFKHVVHVNGTRGKSTVSRLIEAGLRADGISVFCKTTGTNPMTIDVNGVEAPIHRRGKANIKEQIAIMCQAAGQGAEVLVVECMALQPELQRTAQHDILKADVGVITNVRIDHTDVMGETLPQIATALANTVPRGGVLFTAEDSSYQVLEDTAAQLDSEFHRIRPDGSEPDFDFVENIALAVAVCQHLGADRETALRGMAQFQRDPFALSLHRWGQSIFVNGLSINDIQSTCMVWADLCDKHNWAEKRHIVLVNNRLDRGSRTRDMAQTCIRLNPHEVWLLGASQGYMCRKLTKALPNVVLRRLDGAKSIGADMLTEHQIIFAIGNIADDGRILMDRVGEEGSNYVS